MKIGYLILPLIIILSVSFPAFGQGVLDLDVAINMPDIETMEGSMSVPANLDLLTQSIIKIFADSDDDGNISSEEADAFWDTLTEEEKANLSLRLEDLEPIIQHSVGIDYNEPWQVEVTEMGIHGLVGPVNSSTTLSFVITFNAEFNVQESHTHTISIGINESYSGDVDFEFIVPDGWEVDRVTGLTGSTVEGRNVYGTPIGQVDIRISEEIGTDILYICVGIGVGVIVVIILIVFLLVRKKKEETLTMQPPPSQPYPNYASIQQQSYQVSSPSQSPPIFTTPSPQQYPPSPPSQTQTFIPPPPLKPSPNVCPQCGSVMSYIQQYQRYYCYSCGQYH